MNILNHYNKKATEAYLNRVSGFINGKIGNMGDYIRAMFCDSMELEGANWNDDIPAEFEKRRAYSLLPYLPFVLKKVIRVRQGSAYRLQPFMPRRPLSYAKYRWKISI